MSRKLSYFIQIWPDKSICFPQPTNSWNFWTSDTWQTASFGDIM